eukprot:TRINITY_DN6569_c0_g1_i1.p1 TRINITY_DN6569_c0_g1~~TRINITY_DN6569_c0_g1_i1.p1  ORF type:complete len:349 (+),score=123.66 TRINITY_DN6569_c0_g1_i1:105-1151(+)
MSGADRDADHHADPNAAGDEAVEDSQYALRLQLMEYEELERSLPADFPLPDESDLEGRLAILRDIAHSQFSMQQQEGIEALLGNVANHMNHDDDREESMSYDEEAEEEEDVGIEELMAVLNALRSNHGAPGMQLLQLLQGTQMLRLMPQEVDVDNMSYEELTDLCESIGKVNVGLKPEQIAARTVQLNYGTDVRTTPDEKCAICMCEFEKCDGLRKLSCPHYFHTDCIDTWLSESKKCPVCKVEVTKPVPLDPALAVPKSSPPAAATPPRQPTGSTPSKKVRKRTGGTTASSSSKATRPSSSSRRTSAAATPAPAAAAQTPAATARTGKKKKSSRAAAPPPPDAMHFR